MRRICLLTSAATGLTFPEDEDVLPGQGFIGFDPFERLDGHLFFCLGHAHLVKGFYGDVWVFLAEFDQGNSSPRLQGGGKGGQHFIGMIEFVIDVHEQRQIN